MPQTTREGFGWDPPPGGEEPPPFNPYDLGGPPPPPRRPGLDFAPLFGLIEMLRRALPPELRARFTALLREALLTLRALIDWYLERLDGRRREPAVEDIPIE
jgi:hypothetical protein